MSDASKKPVCVHSVKTFLKVPRSWDRSGVCLLDERQWRSLKDWCFDNHPLIEEYGVYAAVCAASVSYNTLQKCIDLIEASRNETMPESERDRSRKLAKKMKCYKHANNGWTPCVLTKASIDENSISEAVKMAIKANRMEGVR